MTNKDTLMCVLATITIIAFVLCLDYVRTHPAQSIPKSTPIDEEFDDVARTAWNSTYQEEV
jgi:hypothetical protein